MAEDYQPMFSVRELERVSVDKNGKYEILGCNGDSLMILDGGYAIAIAMKFQVLASSSPRRADDFISGIVDGLIHADMVAVEKQKRAKT